GGSSTERPWPPTATTPPSTWRGSAAGSWPSSMGEAVFSVGDINRAIGGALASAFPDPFWVVGEVQGFDRDAAKADQRRWGQVYFELIEKEKDADAAKASVKAL